MPAKNAPRCLKPCAGQGGAPHGAAESDSDSGSSLFLTQHRVPEPARSRRRRGSSAPSRAGATQEGPSLSASPRKPTSATAEKNLRFRLPKYTFTLPKEKPSSLTLNTGDNIKMHYAVMGGFFTSVRDLWAGPQAAGDLLSSVPTVDQKGESIAPISEGEETLEDEHFRIVEKKRLVVSSKTRRTQPWYDPQRTGSCVEPLCDKGPVMSRGGPREASRSGLSKRNSSGRALDKTPGSSNALLVQTEASKAKKKIVFEQEEKEDELASDSDATFCELLEDYTQRISEVSADRAEIQRDVPLTNKLSKSQEEERAPEGRSNMVCSESRIVKKKKKRPGGDPECTEEETFHSQEELAELPKGKSEIVDETPDLHPVIIEVDSLLRTDAEDERGVLDSTQKKKKRHRREANSTEEETFQSREQPEELHSEKSVTVDVIPDVPPTITAVDSLSLGDAQDEGGMLDSKQKKKKKKKRRHRADLESTEEEMLPSQEEPQRGNSVIMDETPDVPPTIDEEDSLLHSDAQKKGDTLNSKQKKKKKRHKGDPKSAEEEMLQTQEEPEELHSGKSVIVDETPDRSPTMVEVDTLSRCAAQAEGDMPDSKQKKKKKKKKHRENPESTEEEMFQSPEAPPELHGGKTVVVDETSDLPPTIDDGDARNEGDVPDSKRKKKKKKTRSELADDDIRQEEEGDVESDVRVEENASVLSSCCAEEAGKKKKKKKRRERRDEDAQQLKSDDAAELHKKIKGSNVLSDRTSIEQIDESEDRLEPTEATLEVPESGERKKKKKKHRSVCNDDPGGGENCVDVSASLDVISLGESQELPGTRKKSTSVNGAVTLAPEEDTSRITAEGAEEQDTELLAKKKKKKKPQEDPSLSDSVVQSDDSVSVRKKEKSWSASFPAADAEQSASESAGIRGSSVERDEVREKKKRKVSECAADGDAAVRKKKKKLAGEGKPAVSEHIESAPDAWSSPTPEKKGPSGAANAGQDASTVELVSPSSPVNQDYVRKERRKKMKEVLPEDISFSSGTEAAQMARQNVKAVCSDSSAPSRTVRKDSHKKSKRTLHNPNMDFLTAAESTDTTSLQLFLSL